MVHFVEMRVRVVTLLCIARICVLLLCISSKGLQGFELSGSGLPSVAALELYRVDLDPQKPTFFKDIYKEIMIRNPTKVGSSGSRDGLCRRG